MLWGFKGAHQVLDLLNIHAVEVVVVAGLPGGLHVVDVVDDGLEVDEGPLLLGEGRDGEYAEYKDSCELH